MFLDLDASIFGSSTSFHETKFRYILSKITRCYNMMIADNVKLDNNENRIRDILLLNYLKNDAVRESIGFVSDQVNFDREIQEDHSTGRTDIRITTFDTFKCQRAYYVLECKRLNNKNIIGKTGLNAEYIKNGIWRFTSKYYSSHYRVNAMIGFVVEQLDIDMNINRINKLLLASPSINTTKKITNDDFISDFAFLYQSEHIDIDEDSLKLYHLMYDFNKNIQT
ncbi:MAG: hypothetical protein HRT37_05525 [Alteromonadaceae bacterium]|nr:hypothetical protein [Alteromonadaceae bacterium]